MFWSANAMMTKDQSEGIVRLYSEGLSYVQIAKACNVDRSAIGSYLRRLREEGLLSANEADDDERDRAWVKICCAMHLADLHREHGNRAPSIAA
jgi:hypothetical protein